MLWLQKHTARIQTLVDEGTPESLTFAALQCRLAIEQVCYERLRNAHEYISPDDLRRWQPRDIVNRLIEEVDPLIASEYTVSVSRKAVADGDAKPTAAEYDAQDYFELGRQVGFDPKKIGKIWNALGNFLHVKLPRSKGDKVSFFGELANIRKKVLEALDELRRLQEGTLISNGASDPRTVAFDCNCGTNNKRRASLLKEGQTVSCLNQECAEKWIVRIQGADIGFERRSMAVTCHACDVEALFPEEQLLTLQRNQMMRFSCPACGTDNHLMWKLYHMKREAPPAQPAP